MRYYITMAHGGRTVYLCWGGGSFRWWTPHRSNATRLTQQAAEQLHEKLGGDITPAPEPR
jgi:hypothetical protein